MIFIATLISLLVFLITLSPFLTYDFKSKKIEKLQMRLDPMNTLIQRYITLEKAHEDGLLSKQEWKFQKSAIENQYVELASRQNEGMI